jgi:hypothetical protein
VNPQWFSIEVLDGERSARSWVEIFGDSLVTQALASGALDWQRHRHSFGVVLEFAFTDEDAWDGFRRSLTTQRALDAAPDPVHGVLTYRGRGGSSAKGAPRRPRPFAGAGAAAVPIPIVPEEGATVGSAAPRRLAYRT